MGSLPSVSVVIPTYRRAETLPAIAAPLLVDPALHELIVVADGPNDGTERVVRELAESDQRVRLVKTERAGVHMARFAGALAASGEVVLMIDDDVLGSPGLVGAHAAHHAGAVPLVVLGYMPLAVVRRRPGEYPRDIYSREYERHCARWEAEPDGILKSLWAGNFSVRREHYLQLESQMSEIAKGYHDDMDLGLRLYKLGLVGVFDRALRATHHYTRSPEEFLADARNSGASLAQVYRAHGDVLGPFRTDVASAGLPAAVRWLVRVGQTHRWPRQLLTVALAVFGYLRVFRLERLAAHLLKGIEQHKGTLEPAALR